MTASRSRLLLSAVLAGTCAFAVGNAAAPALTVRAAPQKVTAAGVGAVTIGKRYTTLRAAGRVGPIGPGCVLEGPGTRSALLRAPLKGTVDFTRTAPHRVRTIAISGGATARGVGLGATSAAVKRAFPKAVFDHSTDRTFRITVVRIPKGSGGKLQFAVDTQSKKVVLIAVPAIPFCD